MSGVDLDSLRTRLFGTYRHEYAERDLVLYALGLGCGTSSHLRWLYERHADFGALPTYAILAAHPALALVPLQEYIPGADRANALHGEHYMELRAPVPHHGRLVSKPSLIDVQDKGRGKGVVAVIRTTTYDELSGVEVAVNEFTAFILRTGGLGPIKSVPPARPSASTDTHQPPRRPPDVQATERTHADQAALYRLSGDYNPLHIDPRVASDLGFARPILHGLCTLGISARLLLEHCAGGNPRAFKSIKARFAKPVVPGETLRVDMWRAASTPAPAPTSTSTTAPPSSSSSSSSGSVTGSAGVERVVFQTWVLRADGSAELAVSNAAVELWSHHCQRQKGKTDTREGTAAGTGTDPASSGRSGGSTALHASRL